MPLLLPTHPGIQSATPRPIGAGYDTRPSSGGPIGRNLRPGTRWAWDVDLNPVYYVDSLELDGLLSEDDTIIMDIPQPGLDTGSPGDSLVDGAGQLGRTLNLKGVTPAYVFRKGQWLTIIQGGQRFAYKSSAEAVANGSGLIAIPLRTMLRLPTVNNAVVEIADPKVEGWVTLDPSSLKIHGDQTVWLRFTIEERE